CPTLLPYTTLFRSALNDDAHAPRFIETVPRRGYRFIAEVRETVASVVSRTTEAEAKSSRLPFASKRLYLSIAAVLVLMAGSLVIVLSIARSRSIASSSPPILSMPYKSENFSTADTASAVITPDGKYAAYTSKTGGRESIWLRQIETSENI